ncbi:TonB-dependent receptor [Halioglobus sp. Uisw_031]|uniref:TonB-dependent receptor n=1 Tax=Halioglobus sp. Uisw_031 TaxID=3230977 RepID=UPI0039EA07A0
MLKRKLLASAVVAASVTGTAHAQLEEVLVTATKRTASVQDIPIAVSVLGQKMIEELGITDFTDYVIQLPAVTSGGSGPGQNTIYIRGVASTTPTLTTSGVAGLSPNVALYLDEQPLSQPGRNLDVYVADINRVEVLKGPQGTLFGASSQAGTVRLITNKPDPSGFSGNARFSAAQTSDGDPSYSGEGMINIPISDSFTARAVVYADQQGGYIDNVAGSVDASSSARFRPAGTMRANGVPVSAGRAGFQAGADLSGVNFLSANNSDRTEDNFNGTTYAGGRLSGLWNINDDWDLLVGVANQSIDTDGVFFVDPNLGDLEIQRYEKDSLSDDFDNYNWTLTGRVSDLELLYTGAYTDRKTDQSVDYTDYLFVGQYLPYYICTSAAVYPGDSAPGGTCQSPALFVNSETKTTVQTHEFRVSTNAEDRFRATVGAFYSEMDLRELNSFTYPGSEIIGFGPNFSAEPSSAEDKGQWPKGVIFRNDVKRTDEQMAAFASLDFDITDQFTATLGARYYDVEVDLVGSAKGSFYTKGETEYPSPRGPDGPGTYEAYSASKSLDLLFSGENDKAKTDGVIGRASLAWTPTDDQMYYATWSQGFRPGLLNRPGGQCNAAGSFCVPFALDTDTVDNYELGWKVDLLDNRLRFNGSIFYIEIEDLQTSIFDPSISNLFFSANAANAEVKGIEGELTWAPENVEGLTLSGGISLLDTEITDVKDGIGDVVKGDELAFAPEFKGNLQARYQWDLSDGMQAHVMGNAAYSDTSYTDIVDINRIELDSWFLLGATAGVSTEEWTAEVYADNLTDESAELSGGFGYDVERITVARPLTIGVRFSLNF